MSEPLRIGIVICHRYHTCAGGKCLRAIRKREGAFAVYQDREVELVGYTTCGGCPGGNIEYAPEEMKKNGVEVIHLATGLVVGYPPCPHIAYYRRFIKEKFGIPVVVGTHPIPQKYFLTHRDCETWNGPEWESRHSPRHRRPRHERARHRELPVATQGVLARTVGDQPRHHRARGCGLHAT